MGFSKGFKRTCARDFGRKEVSPPCAVQQGWLGGLFVKPWPYHSIVFTSTPSFGTVGFLFEPNSSAAQGDLERICFVFEPNNSATESLPNSRVDLERKS
ncbi:unnamed protein product [Prunus armeniaca]|uniref:Uncharacterized protein n=1 Tax=Prunus armeniaca TaxID=36596 RepID=A0A6J5V778_PRUAR|nr:unnamed protein product [Prunus armeniaca]CAB4314086.1 unnamed protein product [Prunus armeniaca]